ncbi:Nramp family divalent metal transporter [Liquorilactobacillus nagelii]|uniref:Nramp family divalent metal transporter n=1 Tax=Liquorilactobacillus nagelii TaxID=82688 RepID=UPI0007112443|nr:Nramp family divalent metal transporter [Liquorilactobacillus nagelii]QYH55517.1 divalent metal cation transporter [Liquorilactobacillus nagelii DSM 13675]
MKFKKISTAKSLSEVNGTIRVPRNASFFKTLLAYTGPGILIAVGYMDPGNWITSISSGSQYKYRLLSVILISSLIAMLLQEMCARLGIVTGKDLAQLTREHTSKWGGFFLWIIAELAIMATDIAEVIGSGIALKLLFKIPLIAGILITTADVLLLLFLLKLGFRKIEAIIAALVITILGVFSYEVLLAGPNVAEIFKGYVPSKQIVLNNSMLYLTLGIVGATVMPHDLYLGSSISQTRSVDRHDPQMVAKALRFSKLDSNIQLIVAFVVNSLLLILGAALFYGTTSKTGQFADLFYSLDNSKIIGGIASPLLSILFAVALLASGQSSTITGTLAGQVVMEGFIHLKVSPWIQRLVTRLFSVTPVLIFAIYYQGNEVELEKLLTFSQVFLSIALPFAAIPLVIFTSSTKIMGRFANRKLTNILAWLATLVLVILNVYLIFNTL